MIHTIETLKELHEQRFAAVDKAIVLAADEIARRLEVLNHFHQMAREKERDFIGRETYETFQERLAHDLATIRSEAQTADNLAATERRMAFKAMADATTEQNTKNEIRFGKIEAVYARLIGGLAFGAVILPLITGMLVYLMAKGQ